MQLQEVKRLLRVHQSYYLKEVLNGLDFDCFKAFGEPNDTKEQVIATCCQHKSDAVFNTISPLFKPDVKLYGHAMSTCSQQTRDAFIKYSQVRNLLKIAEQQKDPATIRKEILNKTEEKEVKSSLYKLRDTRLTTVFKCVGALLMAVILLPSQAAQTLFVSNGQRLYKNIGLLFNRKADKAQRKPKQDAKEKVRVALV